MKAVSSFLIVNRSLDLSHLKFLGLALADVLKLKNRPGADKAFSIRLEDVNQFMNDNWEPLGLKPLGKPHAYRMRHGGASYEAASNYAASRQYKAGDDGKH